MNSNISGAYSRRFSEAQWTDLKRALAWRVEPAVKAFREKYKLTDRRFNKRDFFRICAAENIQILTTGVFREMARFEEVAGAYIRFPDGSKGIFIRDLIYGEWDADTMQTALHELGHHFSGHRNGHSIVTGEGKIPVEQMARELECDYFAELMLQPRE